MEKSAQYTIGDGTTSTPDLNQLRAELVLSCLQVGLDNLSLEELRFTKLLLQQLRTSVLKKLASAAAAKHDAK